MLLIFLNWSYILLTTFLCGFAFSRLVEKLFGYQLKNVVELLFYGLMIATVYAQLFSLFGGVGVAANILLVLLCAFVFIRWRKKITVVIYKKLRESSLLYKITIIIISFIWCYCTSRGYMHYDSDLYHAQSIRWIEEYGIVPGLGNIHVRFAYNSSFFALSALYSMRNVAGQSLHTVNGLIALLLSVEVLNVFFRRRQDAVLSDFARLGALYYLTLVYRDIVAPASDYCVMCVVFYLIIRWLSYMEAGETDSAPYALLCVMGVYGVTLKLTAGVILLLVIKPAYLLLRERRCREIALYLLMGVLVLAPWIIRTALISGYLLYPFPALDVLNADWKIDSAAAALDAAEIKTWGRGLNNAALVELPLRSWFPQWFQTMLPALGKAMILADMVCAVLAAGLLLWSLFRYAAGKKEALGSWDKLLVLAAVAASYLFWQLSAPLLRYGYAYVLLLIVLTAGVFYQKLCTKGWIVRWAVVLLAALKTVSLADYVVSMAEKPYYVRQQDYGSYTLDSFELDGIPVYYPQSGDRVGYEYFPAVPRPVEAELRGEGIESGFRTKMY